MARKSKVKECVEQYLILEDGSEHKILNVGGKYIHCTDADFRISRTDYKIDFRECEITEPKEEI